MKSGGKSLSVEQAAAALQVSPRRVLLYVYEGRLLARWVNACHVFEKQDVERLASKRDGAQARTNSKPRDLKSEIQPGATLHLRNRNRRDYMTAKVECVGDGAVTYRVMRLDGTVSAHPLRRKMEQVFARLVRVTRPEQARDGGLTNRATELRRRPAPETREPNPSDDGQVASPPTPVGTPRAPRMPRYAGPARSGDVSLLRRDR
jgi:hypothetical protein